MAQSPVSGDRVTETGSALVAPRFGVVRPVVVLVVRRVGLVVVVALAAMQLLRQLPEVRLVSAVLQVAGDLRLLGFRSAAPHRVSPLARSAGALRLPDCLSEISWAQRYLLGGCSRTSVGHESRKEMR